MPLLTHQLNGSTLLVSGDLSQVTSSVSWLLSLRSILYEYRRHILKYGRWVSTVVFAPSTEQAPSHDSGLFLVLANPRLPLVRADVWVLPFHLALASSTLAYHAQNRFDLPSGFGLTEASWRDYNWTRILEANGVPLPRPEF